MRPFRLLGTVSVRRPGTCNTLTAMVPVLTVMPVIQLSQNAKLALLKSHCTYMSQAMFLLYIRYFLYISNQMRC